MDRAFRGPPAHYAGSEWLEDFAYRIPIGPELSVASLFRVWERVREAW